MVQFIPSKYCHENLVQFMPYTDLFHFILSSDGIVLLKTDEKIFINQYSSHPLREQFPCHEQEQRDSNHFTELFEYQKLYLNIRASMQGVQVHSNYFIPFEEGAYCVMSSLLEEDSLEKTQYFTRGEIEEVLNPENYDGFYFISSPDFQFSVFDWKSSLQLGKSIVPTDEEILQKDLCNRTLEYQMQSYLHPEIASSENLLRASTSKKIEDVRNLSIYGQDSFNLLLTMKDGKMDFQRIQLTFAQKDQFVYQTKPIPILTPSDDVLLSYCDDYEIQSMSESYLKSKQLQKNL